MTLAWVSCLLLFYEVIFCRASCLIDLGTWLSLTGISISWSFYFDQLAVLMLFTVLSISTVVHLYSCGYMEADPHFIRFMSYLSLFTFFMNIIATADNLFVFFLGWEGVGVCSYLLINFWSSRLEANKSALKAILINRVGDCFLFLGMIFIALTCYTLDFSIFLTYFPSFYNKDLFLDIYFCNILVSKYTLISLLLFGGVMGKSAQLGLHTWLPDAMEGPTPVSALIHAATMVTAGTFLLIRCAPIFQLSSLSIYVITSIGALTSFIGAIIGLFQFDIKKVIAYSTLSQLGYMVFACGTANYEGAMFHLVNHAFF